MRFASLSIGRRSPMTCINKIYPSEIVHIMLPSSWFGEHARSIQVKSGYLEGCPSINQNRVAPSSGQMYFLYSTGRQGERPEKEFVPCLTWRWTRMTQVHFSANSSFKHRSWLHIFDKFLMSSAWLVQVVQAWCINHLQRRSKQR